MRNLKNYKGITLIALVITIVVLLILAAVSLSVIMGDDGILSNAANAKKGDEAGKERDAITLAVLNCYTINENQTLTKEQLDEQLSKKVRELGAYRIETVNEDTFKVIFENTGNEYEVDSGNNKMKEVYGNSSIVPSDPSLFSFTLNEATKTATVDLNDDVRGSSSEDYYDAWIDGVKVTEIVIPYEYEHNGDIYKVTTIGYYGFYGLRGLIRIFIPNTITNIESRAFSGCEQLEKLNIPSSVIYMNNHVVWECESLSDIYCNLPSQPAGWNALWNNGCSATVHWAD